MFAITISEKGGESKRLEFDKAEITIGRVQGNDIILPKGNVSKRHSRIVLKDGKFIIVDLKSTNGTYVNGRKITSPIVIKGTDKVYIGDFVLSVEDQAAEPQTDLPPPLPPPAPRRATVPPPPPARRAGPEQRTMGLAAVDPGEEIAPPPAMHDDPPALAAAEDEEDEGTATPPPQIDEPPPAPEPVREPPRAEPPRVEPPRPNRTLAPSALPPRPAPRPTVMGDPGARAIRDGSAQPAAQPAGGAAAARPAPAPLPSRSPPAATPTAPPPAIARERQPSVPAIPAVRREAPPAPEPVSAPVAAAAPQRNDRAPVERAPERPASSDRIPAMGRAPAAAPAVEASAAAPDRARAVEALKQIVARLTSKLNLDGLSREQLAEASLAQRAQRLAGDVANEMAAQLPAGLDVPALARDAVAEALGTGAFETLLADPSVTEVSVPRHDRVLAVRDGERALTDRFFSSPEALLRALTRLSDGASPHKGVIEARLAGGVLLTAVVEPLVARGAVVTLRRPRSEPPTLDGLASEGLLSSHMAEFLALAVHDRRNILVTGAATSGRATIVAALAHGAGDGDHVVLIEDREHETPAGSSVARLTTRAGARETLAAALRLHPDRLVVDDSHGQAAAAALEAMVGLPGTIASSPGTSGADGVSRFLAQARLAPGAPDAELLREALADHLHLVVHVARCTDNKTRVTQIAEVERIDGRGRAALADVFAWKSTASGGDFNASGHVPTFAEGAAPSMFKN